MAAQNPRDMREYLSTLERLSKQQRAMPAMIAAKVEEGKEEEKETKARRPAPPIELEAQTGFYRDPATNRHRVRLSMDFPDVIFNTDGTKALIKQYELWGREETESTPDDDLLPEDERPWEQQATNTESFFRVHGYVPGRKWRFRARALGIESIQPGEWSEEFVITMARDTTPPPQPSAPIAEATRGQIIVTWDGKAVSGNMPADFSYTILAHGTESSPTKEVARFGPEGGFTVISGAAYNKPQHFRLRAVDESGNLGPWSEQVTAITKPLVDVDIILSEIDAGKTQIKNASKIIIETGVELGQKLKQHTDLIASTEKKLTGPGGLTDRLEDAEAILDDAGSLMFETGQTLRQKLSATDAELEAARKRLTITEADVSSAAAQLTAAEKLIASNNTALNTKLTAANTAIGNAQQQVDTLRTITLPALNTSLTAATGRLTAAEGKVTAAEGLIATAQQDITKAVNRLSPLETGINTLNNTTIPKLNASITGKSTIVRDTVTPHSLHLYGAGDRWEVWNDLGPGGKLLETYRHTGVVWRKELLDATYLPLVDIGAGTFGSLTGGRLVVGSVSADRLLIGVGENLLADPSFEDPVISARRAGSNANWSWVQDALTGSYMTVTADSGDMQLGNASNAEMFPIDPKGALAFTAEFSGPDLQVYLQVRYADGTANTGPYLQTLTSETKGTGKRTATVQWDFAAPSLSSTGSPPVSARPILRARPGGTQKVYSVRLAAATKGELIVNGTITGDHVQAESVAAKVGQFVKLNVENLVATKDSTLNNVVAQQIAAGTASFQTVDVKNLFVTGKSSLDDVVANRIAAEAGKFITLNVDQLDVAGNANFKTAVADKLFVNMFATNKLTTNELLVGKGENMIPWAVNNPVESRTVEPHAAMNGASALNLDGGGGMVLAHALTNNQNVTPGTYATTIQLRPGVKYPNLPTGVFQVLPSTKYKVSVWVRAGGTYATYPKIRLNVGMYDETGTYHSGPVVSAGSLLTWSWQEIVLEFETKPATSGAGVFIQMDQPGVLRIDQPSLTKDGASLIATGGIVADHITASEAMSAKMGQFLKLDAGSLTVTGSTKLNEAVAKTFFSEIFATNKLTAQQAYIGGSNLFGATMDDPGWSSGGTASSTGGRNNDPSLLITAAADQVGSYFGLVEAEHRAKAPRLIPGQKYRASVWVRGSVAIARGMASIYMRLYAENGGAMAWASPSKITNDTAIPANTWGKIEGFFEVPEGPHVVLVPGVYSEKGYSTGNLRFSGFALQDATTPDLIVENGILARHITASEEMSAKIGSFLQLDVGNLTATGTSNLNTAVVNNLWTNVVRSRSITTDMLLVGKGTNLIPNGDLANGKEGWNNSYGIYEGDPAAVRMGYPNSIWVAGNATYSSSARFSLKGGQKYQFSMYARANTTGKRFYVQLMTTDSDVASPYLVTNQLTYTGSFREYGGEFTAPEGATAAYLRIFANHTNGSTTAGHQWFTGFELYEKNGASLIVDGGIVTKHLTVTEDMTVALLKAHKVKAGEIDTNSLAADTVFTGLLDAKLVVSDMFSGKLFSGGTFTGSIFRTHTAANTGVQLDSVGLRAWNTAKIQTFTMNASNGNVSIQNGTFTGGMFQTTSAANRGIKLSEGSLAAYTSRGKLAFMLDAAEGDAMFDSRVVFGTQANPKWVIVPWESTSSERAGIWLVNPSSTGANSGIGGTDTAGMFMDNSNATFMNQMHIRGANGGGVKIWGRLVAEDMYSGTIQHAGGNYKLWGANGSYFNSSVEFNGRIIYGGAPSTTSGANAHIASADGTIWKSSSASRFKIDPRPMRLDEALLEVPVEDWIDRAQFEHQRELLAHAMPHTEATTKALAAVNLDRVPGSIAEKVEAAGGKAFVTYDRDGLIEGLSYDRFALARTAILKTQLDRAVARIEALEGMMA